MTSQFFRQAFYRSSRCIVNPCISCFLILFFVSTAYSESYASEPQDKTFVVAYAQDTMANDWRAAQVKQLQREFARHPRIKFIYTDAGGNTAKQIQDIEGLL